MTAKVTVVCECGQSVQHEQTCAAVPRLVLPPLIEGDAFLVLTWRCETCGWETTLPVPGFGGDGFDHFPDGVHPCGPLVARRAARREA